MCFSHDYDWRATVIHLDDKATSDKPVKCDECRRIIQPGTPYTHLHQQENDPDDWPEAWLDRNPDAEEADVPAFEPGETYDWDCCQDCANLLDAVEAAEREEGCTGDETRPALGELRQAMHDDRRDGWRYLKKARELHPHLTAEYLAHMAGTAGQEDDQG